MLVPKHRMCIHVQESVCPDGAVNPGPYELESVTHRTELY